MIAGKYQEIKQLNKSYKTKISFQVEWKTYLTMFIQKDLNLGYTAMQDKKLVKADLGVLATKKLMLRLMPNGRLTTLNMITVIIKMWVEN